MVMEKSKRYSKWLINKYPDAKLFDIADFTIVQLEMLNFLFSREYSVEEIYKYKMYDYKFSQIAKYHFYHSNGFDELFIDYIMDVKVRMDMRAELLKLKNYYDSRGLIDLIELGYSYGQLKQIRSGHELNVDVDEYSDIKNSWIVMKKIRMDLIKERCVDGS
jgi:hypothetical protein